MQNVNAYSTIQIPNHQQVVMCITHHFTATTLDTACTYPLTHTHIHPWILPSLLFLTNFLKLDTLSLHLRRLTWITDLYFQTLCLEQEVINSSSVLGVSIQLKPGRINSMLLFLYSIQRTERILWRILDSKIYFCTCIPYGQLMLAGMLCTCLWDKQLLLPRDGQFLQ